MPRIVFTRNLQRHTTCPVAEVAGDTVGAALANYFLVHPRVRSYVLDDQGAVRHHVAVFVDGRQMCDRTRLSDTLGADSEIYVMQALSGGAT